MEYAALVEQVEADKRRHLEIKKGQNYGIISTLAAFSVAGLALVLGYPTVAGTVCSVVVVALATAFITGRKASP